MTQINSAAVAAQQPGFLNSIKEAGTSGVNWLTTNGKSLAGSASATLCKVASAVSSFFSASAAKIGSWMSIGKDAMFAAAGHVKALPNSTKAVVAVALAVSALAGSFIGRCFAGSKPAPATAQATQVQPAANTPAAPETSATAATEANTPVTNAPAETVQGDASTETPQGGSNEG